MLLWKSRGWRQRAAIAIEIWRRGRDSNPRYPLRYVRFRGGSFQPLTHLSGEKQLSVAVGELPVLARFLVRNRNSLRLRHAPDDQQLTAVSKERLQYFRTAARKHSAAD